jgi:AraC-like DNA-binding protein
VDSALIAETALRGAAMGFCAVAAVPLARRSAGRWRLLPPVLALTLCAYLAVSAPWGLPPGLQPVLILLASLNPPLLWTAGLGLLDAGRMAGRAGPPLVAAFALVALARPLAPALLGGLHGGAMALLYGHVLWLAWIGSAGDLVEPRRGLRRALAGVGAGIGLAVAGVETGLVTLPASLPAGLLQAAVLALVAGTVLAALALPPAPDAEAPPAPAAAPLRLSDAEAAVLDRLRAAMAARVWAEEGLTVGALAARLNTAEHRLRRVINRGLGYRNFARFINEHRIAAAQAILADPATADRGVQQIAYDTGFGSPGPFNRAFREITGQNPTAFRAAALAAARAAPEPEIPRRG